MIRKIAFSNLILLSFLFWSRVFFVVIFNSKIDLGISLYEWLLVLFNSFRFDAMLAGYVSVLFLFFAFFAIWSDFLLRNLHFVLKFIFSLCILFFTFISIFDVLHFHLFNDRFSNISYEGILHLQFNTDTFFFLTSIAYLYLGFSAIRKINRMKLKFESFGIGKWLFCLLITALFIRSSLGEHHLDLRNADVTKSPKMNVAIIPSPYALDQAIKSRR